RLYKQRCRSEKEYTSRSARN
ncbi:hypothetical protein A5795_001477, partial [Enterococcus faecalis]